MSPPVALSTSTPSSSADPFTKSRRHKHRKRPHDAQSLALKDQILQVVAILAVAGVVASCTFILLGWVEERRKPFCDTGVALSSSGDCVICPEHGNCQNGRLECLPGYKRSGISCIEDQKIEKRADHLAFLIQEHVCRVNGQFICNGSGGVWISKADILNESRFEQLKEELALSDEEFKIVQDKAFEHAMQNLDTRENFQGMLEFSCPSTIVHRFKPLDCRLQDWLLANWVIMSLLCIMIFFAVSLTRRYWLQLRVLAHAEDIYMQVCDALEAKARGGHTSESFTKETWIVASHLRDHLLSRTERKTVALWREVERLAKEDSRIDQYPRMVKGESKIVWEWQVEGSMTSTKKGSRQRAKLFFG